MPTVLRASARSSSRSSAAWLSAVYITITLKSNLRLALVLCVHQGLSIVLSSQAPFLLPHNSQAQRQEVQKDTVVEGHRNGNCSRSARHTRPLHANIYLAPQPVRQTLPPRSLFMFSNFHKLLRRGQVEPWFGQGFIQSKNVLKSLLSSLKWASKDDCHLTSTQET